MGLADQGFHREVCYTRVIEILQKHNDSFLKNPFSLTLSNTTNPVLTLDECRDFCGGPGIGWYPDTVSRLVTWLLPVILLITNMKFPSIGPQRFLLIPRLLGDPIDSTWSFLAKVDYWGSCFSYARTLSNDRLEARSVATVIAANEELSKNFDRSLIVAASRRQISMADAAITLSENRNIEILRTILAVANYVFQVLAAFVPAVGAASKPSGGRIGTAMLLSWLVSVVLLSNATGDIGSRRNCRQVLADLTEHLRRQLEQNTPAYKTSAMDDDLDGADEDLTKTLNPYSAWSGALCRHHPNKQFRKTAGWKLALISVLPVGIAFGTAFAVLDTGPTYFSCRHILILVVFAVWLLSAVTTFLLSSISATTGKQLSYVMLIKDVIVACAILALIIASSCGLFNTCYCWSGALVHGTEKARVQLNPTHVFDRNNNVVYPAVVAVCLSLQVCVFGIMLWIGWPGFRLIWWTKAEKELALSLRPRNLRVPPKNQSDAVKLEVREEVSDRGMEPTT